MVCDAYGKDGKRYRHPHAERFENQPGVRITKAQRRCGECCRGLPPSFRFRWGIDERGRSGESQLMQTPYRSRLEAFDVGPAVAPLAVYGRASEAADLTVKGGSGEARSSSQERNCSEYVERRSSPLEVAVGVEPSRRTLTEVSPLPRAPIGQTSVGHQGGWRCMR